MRDYIFESALKAKLLNNGIGPAGHHGRGWSHVGNCIGAYCLSKLYPEIAAKQPKGAMYPGTMCHEFFQNYVFIAGSTFLHYEILGHEQEVFVMLKNGRHRMSPIDTLFWDPEEESFWVVDYKSSKADNLLWTETDAKIGNRMQINLYAYALQQQNPLMKVGGYMVFYINKENYDRFQVHKYDVDLELAKDAIDRLNMGDQWLNDEQYREEIPWTTVANGLGMLTKGKNPYRYICEPSTKTPSYTGCPYKHICLKLLSEEYNDNFTSFIRYDKYLSQGDDEYL